MLFLFWIFCIIATPMIARSKGKDTGSYILAAILFGPLALLWALLSPRNEKGIEYNKLNSNEAKKCPYCAELIKPEARVCRFCGKTLRKK